MRMRALRLATVFRFGLPDTSSPLFAAEAHGNRRSVANSPTEADDQAFVDCDYRS